MRIKYVIVILLTVICLVGCFGRKSTCCEVAESFATYLHRYMGDKGLKYREKLSKLSSEFTMIMIDEDGFDDYFEQTYDFSYRFIRDSVSADRMKAYVWYTNDKCFSAGECVVRRLRLRHSLRGWIVDLPLH